jgi:hypothetical protein
MWSDLKNSVTGIGPTSWRAAAMADHIAPQSLSGECHDATRGSGGDMRSTARPVERDSSDAGSGAGARNRSSWTHEVVQRGTRSLRRGRIARAPSRHRDQRAERRGVDLERTWSSTCRGIYKASRVGHQQRDCNSDSRLADGGWAGGGARQRIIRGRPRSQRTDPLRPRWAAYSGIVVVGIFRSLGELVAERARS